MTPAERQHVNKRLSLNLLIQGAATHVYRAGHHLAKEELDAINPELVSIYDSVMALDRLSYFKGILPELAGFPLGDWDRLPEMEKHILHHHPFMRTHGPQLAEQAFESAIQRCYKFDIEVTDYIQSPENIALFHKVLELEAPNSAALQEIGKSVCCQIYGIDRSMLHAELTMEPRWGEVREPHTAHGKAIIDLMSGWGGVQRFNGRLEVVAKALCWSQLIHELVKGTVELICLHGLGQLDDENFGHVMEHTEQIELEFPMLQIGGEFFKRYLEVVPREVPIATCIMRTALMTPETLESFLDDMMISPNRATDRLRESPSSR